MQMTNCDRPEAYPSRGGFLLGDYLMASTGLQGAALGYIGGSNALNKPSATPSLGFVERAAGVANGLDVLQGRLESLLARIDGNGEPAASKNPMPGMGLGSQLSDAESRLRACLALADELNARF
jgi:hypothetical protein